MTEFWEWGPGPDGKKQAHLIRDAGDEWLWAAGIWEIDAEFGPCFSMVTTPSSPAMAPLHDRMPAILGPEPANEWLRGTLVPSDPYPGKLSMAPCPSPLVDPGDRDRQPELF